MQAVQQIQRHNRDREPERLMLKYRAMRASTFGFLRGSCHLFYDRLPQNGLFKSAPSVWVCGDLHVENFGSYKGDNRLAYFDLNDFDEAALAPATWDLVRFLTSVRIRGDDLPGVDVQALCNAFVEAYAASLVSGKAYWLERETAQGLVRELLDGLRARVRVDFLNARSVVSRKQRVLKVDGVRALPPSASQRTAVTQFMAEFAQTQADPHFFKVLDVARRIAGTGSLGIDRFAVLVHGKGSPDGNYLLDLKQVFSSSLLPKLKLQQPAWKNEAERVVALQRQMQAVPMAFLQAVVFQKSSYVLRDLQPSEDRVVWPGVHRTQVPLLQLVTSLGRLVAWAQLRSAGRSGSATADELIAFGQKRKWKTQLLDAAKDCEADVRKDAASFNAAFDAGELSA